MKNALSYKLIERAVSGDETAIKRIISIYEPYINTLASKELYDGVISVNIDLKDHLVRKLIS